MKKVLIPTDFSDNSKDAIAFAIELFKDIPCTFYILNTYDVLPMGSYHSIQNYADVELLQTLNDTSTTELHKIQVLLSTATNSNHVFKTLSKAGDLRVVVKEIVETEHINLVVMGTAGASGLKEYLFGSNTVSIINTLLKCPVIAVPKGYKYKDLKKIDFATNLKYVYTNKALSTISEILQLHNLNIEILHIKKEKELNEYQQEALTFLKKYFKNSGLKYKEVAYSTDSIADSITSYCRDQNVDMICLANYKHSLFEKLLHEPVISKVGFHTEVPLLVFSIY